MATDVAPEPYPGSPEPDATHGTHEGTEAHGGAKGGGGLPQLKPESFAGQLFWLAVTFALLFVLLTTVALPRIGAVLAARKARIKADLDDAAAAQRRAEEAGQALELAMAEARNRARKLGEEARERVRAEVDATTRSENDRLAADVARAEARIQQMREAALANVRGIATETASAVVERLSGTAADPAVIAAAVDGVLARG
ncbi:MAG TPA: F0F1 ATP synthase subunit B' [Alphaproteobacteria bacterium]|nr:F0F1 ATP synthase subunit B' [Alphaproteobacteria bacterium]HAJ48076.1 F0F1 ATP synthase subunit B' [Alphaproteobacteria bacterium]